MTFLFDHDVADEVAQMLRYWGHEVILLRMVLPTTAKDSEIFAYACETHQAEAAHFLKLIETAGEDGLRGNINFA